MLPSNPRCSPHESGKEPRRFSNAERFLLGEVWLDGRLRPARGILLPIKQAYENSLAHARQPHAENRNAIRPNRDGRPSLLRCTGGVVKSAVADSAFSTLFLLGLLIVGHKVKRQVSLALEDG
jgi:hypothetical protein